MVRKKVIVKKIENPSSLQVTYCKRRDGIIKKASELAVLCDTDVGLVMFSPTGRLNSFASNGRIEDIFLRYIDRPNELRGGPIENEECLYRSLKNSKYEGEILEKIAKYYNPDVEKITSIYDALVHQKFLTNAIQRIEEMKAKLLGKQIVPLEPDSIEVGKEKESQSSEVPVLDIKDSNFMAEESVDSNGRRNPVMEDHHQQKTCSLGGPHLSIDYLKTQSNWNLQCGSTSQG
ncbi:agamous-like mads-box protein agl104 [Quercus suber]|uniref:Agamous-like mads-box protein agl104 n=1 Tax=Quercus suber TaxID=58331 RepID=A0AAW0L569_QUESU